MIDYYYFKYKEHPITNSSGELKDLPEDMIQILNEWQVEFADKAIVAYDNSIMVGFLRYDLGKIKPWLYDAGTYIIPEYRNQNIGYNLWHKAIMRENPNKIIAHIASDGGLKLIKRIQKCFPRILFDYSLDKKVKVA